MPQIAVNPGEAISFDIPYTVTAYELKLKGINDSDYTTVLEIDRVAGKFKIGDNDIGTDLSSLLGG